MEKDILSQTDAQANTPLADLKAQIAPRTRIGLINVGFPKVGMASLVVYILNGLRYCERENLYPVVDLDNECDCLYFDPTEGDNMWHQYFEPVMPLSSDDLKQLRAETDIEQLIHRISREQLERIYHQDDDSAFTSAYGKWRTRKIKDLDQWYQEQRNKGGETIGRYIKPNSNLLGKVDAFVNAYFGKHGVLGVHIRGTDLEYMPIVSPAEYLEHVDARIRQDGQLKIFLATDQSQYLDLFKQRYGDRLLYTASFRSDNDVGVHFRQELSPYDKGEQVLIDTLLLSRCDFLIKGNSSVPELAMYFNKDLQCLDLGYKKKKSFGESYGFLWRFQSTKAAWTLLSNTNLDEVPKDHSSQNLPSAIRFLGRKLMVIVGVIVRKVVWAFRKGDG